VFGPEQSNIRRGLSFRLGIIRSGDEVRHRVGAEKGTEHRWRIKWQHGQVVERSEVTSGHLMHPGLTLTYAGFTFDS